MQALRAGVWGVLGHQVGHCAREERRDHVVLTGHDGAHGTGYLLGNIRIAGFSFGPVAGAAKSSVPALGYTGTYAFADVLLMVAGSLILLI